MYSSSYLVLLNPSGKSPDTWDDMPSESPVFCVDLKPDGIEYNEVLDAFNKSMSKGNNYTDIVRIQRIQNPKLYSLYAQAKEQMDKTNPLNRQNESQLFHGTDYTSAIAINTNGFNRIYAGKHGMQIHYVCMLLLFHWKLYNMQSQ